MTTGNNDDDNSPGNLWAGVRLNLHKKHHLPRSGFKMLTNAAAAVSSSHRIGSIFRMMRLRQMVLWQWTRGPSVFFCRNFYFHHRKLTHSNQIFARVKCWWHNKVRVVNDGAPVVTSCVEDCLRRVGAVGCIYLVFQFRFWVIFFRREWWNGKLKRQKRPNKLPNVGACGV